MKLLHAIAALLATHAPLAILALSLLTVAMCFLAGRAVDQGTHLRNAGLGWITMVTLLFVLMLLTLLEAQSARL